MEKRAPDAFYNQFEVSEATQAAFHMLNANILLAHVGDNDQGRNFFHNLKIRIDGCASVHVIPRYLLPPETH